MRVVTLVIGVGLLAGCGSGGGGSTSKGSSTGASLSASAAASTGSSGASSRGSTTSAASTASTSTGSSTSTASSSSSGASISTSSSSSGFFSHVSSSSTSSGSTTSPSSSTASSSSGSTGSCGADGTTCQYDAEDTGTCCSGICQYDLSQNPQNCGSCGNICPSTDFCAASGCYPYTCDDSGYCFLSDAGVGTCCGAQGLTCLDASTDEQNCGSCGNPCGAGQICSSGFCLASDCTLPTNVGRACLLGDGTSGDCCDQTCAASTDCLACGEVCPTGSSCSAGTSYCQRPDAGYAYCSTLAGDGLPCPEGTACDSDSRCAPLPSSCTEAMLGSVCAGGSSDQVCCGTTCAALETDDANCGICGNVCSSGTWCHEAECQPIPTCAESNVGVACPADGGAQGLCCGDACVNPVADSENCGKCGAACPAGQVCQEQPGNGGLCSWLDGGQGGCYLDEDCPPGSICTGNACYRPSCAPGQTGGSCAFGEPSDGSNLGTCCEGACADLNQDPSNCGACGTACASGICVGSYPFPGQAQCSPDLSTDAGPYDAGPFGFDCAIFGCGQPGLTCINHQCIEGSCQLGAFSDLCVTDVGVAGSCCTNFEDVSTCHDLSSEANNCGGCGWTCPADSTCTNGSCSGVTGSCGPGHHGEYCDLDAGPSSLCCESGCAEVLTDDQNCGTCGYACYSGLSCVAGTCTALSCTANTPDAPCAADGGAGNCCSTACVSLDSDPLNCGECGRHCTNGTTCQNGGCGLDACTAQQTGDPCHLSSGYVGTCCSTACVDTTQDPNNCGGCGFSCAGDGDGGCSQSNCE